MKAFKNLLVISMLTVAASTVWGAERLELSDAISRALEHNYDIRIFRRNESVAAVNNSWGAAGRFPTLTFSVSSNNRSDYRDTGDVSTTSLTPGVGVNWTLFDGFAIRIRKEKLETFERLSRGNTALMVEQTVQSVIFAYHRALLEHGKRDVLGDVMSLSKDRYDYEQARKEIGSSVTFDVLLAQNAWLEDKSRFMQQEVVFSNAVRDLKYLMGVSEDVTFEFPEGFTAPLNDYARDDLLGRMLADNTTLKNQYLNLMQLDQEIRLARSLYLPTLSLRAGADAVNTRTNPEGASSSTLDSRNMYGNLTLSFSLFDGGSRKRALTIARIQEDVGEIETDEMKHRLSNELAKLLDLYNVRKDLHSVAEENLKAARLNMDISGDRFRAGTINSFNYRDVQLVYLNAALNQLNAVFNLIETDTALLRVTGGIITRYGDE